MLNISCEGGDICYLPGLTGLSERKNLARRGQRRTTLPPLRAAARFARGKNTRFTGDPRNRA